MSLHHSVLPRALSPAVTSSVNDLPADLVLLSLATTESVHSYKVKNLTVTRDGEKYTSLVVQGSPACPGGKRASEC